jgi:phosphonate transport system permease protein
MNVSAILFLLAAVYCSKALRGSGREMNYWQNLVRFAKNFLPPDLSVLPETLEALGETFQIAVMATLFAVLLSLPLAIAGARTMSPTWVVVTARFIMNAIRTVPSLIWALIAVAVVGANSLAGVLALTFYSMGYLGKMFSDTFESVDLDVARAIRALGADTVQAFQNGIWPHAKPFVWSHSLWMLEYNLRSAAIIGYVGAGGIGVQLHSYAEYYAWRKFATVLAVILILVTALDFLGEWVRKRATKPQEKLSKAV